MANENGGGSVRGITISGTTLTKVLASLNGILLAVSLYFLSSFGGAQAKNTERLNTVERNVAVIQGNRFTAGDAIALQHDVSADITAQVQALRLEMNARFDRLEDRINRIGGGEQ